MHEMLYCTIFFEMGPLVLDTRVGKHVGWSCSICRHCYVFMVILVKWLGFCWLNACYLCLIPCIIQRVFIIWPVFSIICAVKALSNVGAL